MGIDTKAYQKELLESFFEAVGEEFNSENTWLLFDGNFLPEFSDKVEPNRCEWPNFSTRDTDPDYQLKIEAYQVDSNRNRAERETLLREAGYEFIESEGGGEGQGEYCYGVIKLGEVYLKAEWSYYSYNGCEYDYILETVRAVTPKTKTITVYE